jgi:hypothetical protein
MYRVLATTPQDAYTRCAADRDLEADAVVTERAVYTSNGVTTTVTTAALDFDPDADGPSVGGSKDSEEASSSVDEACGVAGAVSTTGRGVLRNCIDGGEQSDDKLGSSFPTAANELVLLHIELCKQCCAAWLIYPTNPMQYTQQSPCMSCTACDTRAKVV